MYPRIYPKIDPKVISHRLAVDPKVRPRAQKRGKLSLEKRRATTQETKKLLKAGFIQEVHFTTWLANIVMVSKSSKKWRMYVDFTNSTKHAQRTQPLPSIDRLVAKHQRLNSLVS